MAAQADKWQLRQIDQIRACAVLAFGKCSCTGQPAGISSHNFNDRNEALFIFQTETVADNFFYRCTDVFSSASISRCMVCECQVIVDCFRASDEVFGHPMKRVGCPVMIA